MEAKPPEIQRSKIDNFMVTAEPSVREAQHSRVRSNSSVTTAPWWRARPRPQPSRSLARLPRGGSGARRKPVVAVARLAKQKQPRVTARVSVVERGSGQARVCQAPLQALPGVCRVR